jgi:hypothetical protein
MLSIKQNKVKNAKFQYVKNRDKRPVITLEFRHKKNNFFTYSLSFLKDQVLKEQNLRTEKRLRRLRRKIRKVQRLKDPRLEAIEKILISNIASFKFVKIPENSNLIAQYSAGCISGYGDKNSKRQKIKHVSEQLAERQASVLLNYFNERMPSLYLKNRRLYFSTKKIVKIAKMFNILQTYKKFKARNKPNTYFKLLYPRKKFKYSKKLSRMAFFDYIYYKNYRHVK